MLFLNFERMKRKYERENKSNQNNLFNNNSQKEDYSNANINLIFLDLFIQINKPYQIIFMISVSNKLKIKELKQQIIENLIQICPVYKIFNFSSFFLLKNYEIININENNLIKDCNLKNGDKLYVIVIENNIIKNIYNQN
jgi:hypothetical protein